MNRHLRKQHLPPSARLKGREEQNDNNLSLQQLAQEHPLVTGDEKILVLGADGQVGQFLVPMLKELYPGNLLLTSLYANPAQNITALDVCDGPGIERTIREQNVKVVINLAALLSAEAEKKAELSKRINLIAPRRIMEIADRNGVRRVFTPSSIAVLGKIAREAGEQDRSEGPGGYGAPIDVATHDVIGNYGIAKTALEMNCADMTRDSQSGLLALSLRYGGVLTCQPEVSNGTTEQLDMLINRAAQFAAKRAFDQAYEGETYHPLIAPECAFPMLDGRTVATETLRFLHSPAEAIRTNGHRYGLAEYSGSMQQVADLLKELAPGFRVEFDPTRYDDVKMKFATTWPKQLDVSDSVKDWGFRQHYTLRESVKHHFNRLKQHFVAKELQARGDQPRHAADVAPDPEFALGI